MEAIGVEFRVCQPETGNKKGSKGEFLGGLGEQGGKITIPSPYYHHNGLEAGSGETVN